MGGGAGGSWSFGNTQGQKELYKSKIKTLPKNPNTLIKRGWTDVTPSGMKERTSSRMYSDKESGLTVRFDKGENEKNGYGSKDHYHVLNPEATGKKDYYLDKNGIPVAKNSKASHIIP